jgi:hypothetical protein
MEASAMDRFERQTGPRDDVCFETAVTADP